MNKPWSLPHHLQPWLTALLAVGCLVSTGLGVSNCLALEGLREDVDGVRRAAANDGPAEQERLARDLRNARERLARVEAELAEWKDRALTAPATAQPVAGLSTQPPPARPSPAAPPLGSAEPAQGDFPSTPAVRTPPPPEGALAPLPEVVTLAGEVSCLTAPQRVLPFTAPLLNPVGTGKATWVLGNEPVQGETLLLAFSSGHDVVPLEDVLAFLSTEGNRHRNAGLKVVAVASTQGAARDVSQAERVSRSFSFPVISDRFGIVSRRLGVRSFPCFAVVNDRRQLVASWAGMQAPEAASRLLAELLGRAGR